jgi:sodium/pantothenate symporter
MGIELSVESAQVLVAFGVYLVGVAALGVFAHRYMTKGSFVKEYFLGNRGLGPWVLALTVAATAISGGSFMGFPSLVYSKGWVMALWICSYMVVPLTGMIWLGKRINQVARIGGSVTVPDIFRDRFQSPALGVLASLLLLVFLCFNLVAQFKAGGLVLKEALRLPPAEATFRAAAVDADHNLILTFDTSRGQETQKTPLPSKTARFLDQQTRVDQEQRQVHVFFEHDGKLTEKKVRFPPQRVGVFWLSKGVDKGYLIGLLVFALTVVAYTTYGGFWAVTWTDVLEGLVMLIGVVVMAILALRAVEPVEVKGEKLTGLAAATERLRQQDPKLVTGPGPEGTSTPIGHGYLPLGMAFSFFLMWSVGGAGQPSGMVRLMSFKDTPSLRRALVLIGLYYFLTYVSLLIIFICARAIFPTEYLREMGSEGEPDSIMPAMTRHLAHPLVAGLLLAAPYAAIMSTVAAFLLMISSSLVRDLYQRTINPRASQKTLKRVSYLTTALMGLVVMLGAINPPGFLQYVIVFTGSGQTCAFLLPMVLTLYWKRATRQGVLAGMLGGGLTVMLLYVLGWIDTAYQKAGSTGPAWLSWFPGWGQKREEAFAPLYAGGCDPLIWGLLASLVLALMVSLRTKPDPDLVKKYFP